MFDYEPCQSGLALYNVKCHPPLLEPMLRPVLAIALCSILAVSGCATSESSVDAPASLAPNASLLYIGGVNSDTERNELNDLVVRSTNVIESDDFKDNLLSLASAYPSVYVSPSMQSSTVQDVWDILSLARAGTRRVRMPVALVGGEAYGGGNFNYTARTGPTGAFTNQPTGGSMSIGRVNMYRNRQWSSTNPQSGDIVDHSCAINTVAHEIAHTVSTSGNLYEIAFVDGAGRSNKSTPLASYLIGSVAQCTYLEQNGRIDSSQVAQCVEIFGTHNFNNARCPSFSGGRRVEARSNLPAAASAN